MQRNVFRLTQNKFTDIFTDQETNMTNGLNNLLQHEINSLTEYGEPAIKWWIN